MRKIYLDNIRTIVILGLFPYHTFMIWNNFGMKFYIWGGNNNILSSFIVLVSSWFMPILFVIAGISARYSLKRRNMRAFIKERIHKLLIPFVSGVIFLIPFQTLYARKFFFGYDGGIIDNFRYFFSHFSDWNGYDGRFTLGHLWFLLYLFIIAIITLFVIKKVPFQRIESKIYKVNIVEIILLFIPVFIFHLIGNFGGKSLGKYLFLYLIGYYLFSDGIIEKIINKKAFILSLFVISQIMLVILYFQYGYYGDLFVNFVGWLGVLSGIIIGKLFLNKENEVSNYFKRASFPIYILHQTILVVVGYYSLRVVDNIILQMAVVIIGSFIITIIFYEMICKIPVLKRLIGGY